ncbi:hypothetical protein BV25DRAFT_1830807 [Artomyces pyxidatus]|uniref:Uncharacterized protein n=1 Tax=Artomyces pyxidatus TaxID=48021 RepID=A0ACB8SN93_9AGAM|nr:hypothetical protein BV25DRAFT_1830807 [Artomyces pyxidatus]
MDLSPLPMLPCPTFTVVLPARVQMTARKRKHTTLAHQAQASHPPSQPATTYSPGKRTPIALMDAQDPETPSEPFGDLPTVVTPDMMQCRHRAQPPISHVKSTYLSAPHMFMHKPSPEHDPPLSMRYEAFTIRYEKLDKAGVIKGKGVWPDDSEICED